MATELETLIVTLEASTKQYERALAKAQGTTVAAMRKIEGSVRQSETRLSGHMERVGQSMGKGLLRGLQRTIIGGVGIAGIVAGAVAGIKAEAQRVLDLRLRSLRLQISPVTIQGLEKLAARQGLPAESVSQGLEGIQQQYQDQQSYLNRLIRANVVAGKIQQPQNLQDVLNFIADFTKSLAPANRAEFMRQVSGAPELATVFAQGADAIKAATDEFLKLKQIRPADEIESLAKAAAELQSAFDSLRGAVDSLVQKYFGSGASSDVNIGGSGGFQNAAYTVAAGGGLSKLRSTAVVMSPDERRLLGLIMQYESRGGQNIPNYKFGPGTTAQGYYQITNKNWRSLAPGLGITAGSAMSGTFDEQTMVALALLRQSGIGNWANFNPRLRRAVASTDNAVTRDVVPPAVPTPQDNKFVNVPYQSEKQLTAAQHVIESLNDEKKALNSTAEAQQEYNNIKAAGIDATPEEITQIKSLTKSLYEQQQAQEQIAQLGQAFEGAFTGFVDALMNGEKASDALRNALKSLASDLVHMAIHQIFSALFPAPGTGGGVPSLLGFQHGGQFRVGGSGGTDSSLVAFRATPGEMVSITPRRLAGAGGGGGVAIGGTVINVAGSADERTVEMLDRRIAANNYRQRKALERDWGAMSMRYQQLRG